MSDTSSEGDFPTPIVLDNGSHRIKAGWAGDCKVRCVMRNVLYDNVADDQFVGGTSSMQRREVLAMTCPIEHGIVSNWADMEKIWGFMYDHELRVEPEEQGILVTEPPLNPKCNREKMAQILFESFQVPFMYVATPAVLTLYANGRVSGVVLDVGETVTHVLSAFDGSVITDSIRRIDIGGKDLNEHLQILLAKKGYSFTTYSEMDDVRHMKEKLCYVNNYFKKGNIPNEDIEKTFTLPDGETISIDKERFLCPEALFKPSLIDCDNAGVEKLLKESVMACDINVREDLLKNVKLSGATTFLPGFSERIHDEMEALNPVNKPVKVIAPPERNKSVWIGGSILASLSSFQSCWVTKAQYEEIGPYVVHRCM